jgi:tylactone mycaminosyltransferase/glycosyltransferase DesVII
VPVGTDHALRDAPVRTGTPFANIDFDRFYEPGVPYAELLGMWTILTPNFLAMANDSLVDGLTAYARQWRPDLVVWEPLTYAGAIAARAVGAVHGRLLWGPDVLGRSRATMLTHLAALPPEHRDDPLGEWLTWTAGRVGVSFAEELTCGRFSIETEPPSTRLETGLETLGMQYVPYNGPAVTSPLTLEPPRRPRICFTLGVSARNGLGRSGVTPSAMIAALATLDVEIVATLDASQFDGTPPDNVHLTDFVPLDDLLPTCSAIVHHGGAGTWSTALRHGVPQVILAETWDAVLKAKRLDALGAGRYLPVPGLRADAVRDAVAALIGSTAAELLRKELRAEPTPAEVAGRLAGLAGERR